MASGGRAPGAVLLSLAAAFLGASGAGTEGGAQAASSWRIVNAEDVEVAWRVRSLQFFGDDDCEVPLAALPNRTGEAFATEAAELTGVEHAFNLRSARGWESVEVCEPGECHVGFTFASDVLAVRCLLLHQGEEGFHAGAVTLQRRDEASGADWQDVATWEEVADGKAKLALACPPVPGVEHGTVAGCESEDERSAECRARCDEGYGAVDLTVRCHHGAWYTPQCLPVGSMVRLVPRSPALMKPYWVILDAALYESADCTGPIPMAGSPISSGEFVIKYASYHPKNAWDSDPSSSWASNGPCAPGGDCYIGWRFEAPLTQPVRCVRLEHPQGRNFQATSISVERLGPAGWEEIPDVRVELLPAAKDEL